MDTQAIFDLLPKGEGLLPKWQLLVAVIGIFNTIQNFVTLKLTRKVYTGVPSSYVSALQARTFAVWTLTSAVVRGYAAYHLYDKRIYDITLFTYLISFGHFSSEILIFRTVRLDSTGIKSVVVSTVSLIWMLRFHDFYVKP